MRGTQSSAELLLELSLCGTEQERGERDSVVFLSVFLDPLVLDIERCLELREWNEV